MDEEEASIPCGPVSQGEDESVYPVYFGISCAFVALHLLSSEKRPEADNGKWAAIADGLLRGSAQLLGLLVWKAQGGESMDGRSELLNKLRKAESEIAELKVRRSEDAKANEKVVSIFASQEQIWFGERKRLRQQVESLLDGLRNLEVKKEEVISSLKKKVEEGELLIRSKDEELESGEQKRKELDEKLQKAEAVVEELKETAKKEKQEHSSEIWKHKTAFIELVSNQRQLEAELGRALRQVDATKEELDAVFEEKEELELLVQKLSVEIVKMEKDIEQKDKILSAMMRKSKLDTAEKQMLLKEVKMTKARRKQTELETERWRGRCESRHDKNLGSNFLADKADLRLETRGLQSIEAGSSQNWRMELQPTNSDPNHRALLLECSGAELGKEVSPKGMNNATIDCLNQYSPEANEELVITTDAKQLEYWVRMETEKYISIIEQRHSAEIDAFAEQMRFKDEKLEVCRWQLLSMELESKRLHSHIQGLEDSLSQFREENMKLEAMLLERETDVKSLKEMVSSYAQHFQSSYAQHFQNRNSSSHLVSQTTIPIASNAKIVERKPREEEQEPTTASTKVASEPAKVQIRKEGIDIYAMEAMQRSNQVMKSTTKVHDLAAEQMERKEGPSGVQQENSSHAVEAPEEEIEEERVVGIDLGHAVTKERADKECRDVADVEKLASPEVVARKDSSWKMDIHALGVSYKIKRLKQQLLLLEKLAAAEATKKPARTENAVDVPECLDKKERDDNHGTQMKGFLPALSWLNKQLKRYQSLEEKTDDLCKRMNESDQERDKKDSSISATKGRTKMLEHFLEETFQLQRYMVATGQKLVDIQSKISSCFEGSDSSVTRTAGFDARQFADHLRTLLRDIQRGLEVRIARIIGDLEGSLAKGFFI
ncbi:hypothetical protein ACLOJK_010312 [Asimina triloba]